MTLEMVPGVGVVRHWLYLAAKALGVSLAVSVLEALRCNSREPERVPSRVSWLGCNRCPSVPWVEDPNSSPRAFCRACGQSRSLDGR
jgi:hypothetical protein